jgi:hypothetical protein
MFDLLQARIIRTAFSPRVATNAFSNIGFGFSDAHQRARATGHQHDIEMASRVRCGGKVRQRAHNKSPGVLRAALALLHQGTARSVAVNLHGTVARCRP